MFKYLRVHLKPILVITALFILMLSGAVYFWSQSNQKTVSQRNQNSVSESAQPDKRGPTQPEKIYVEDENLNKLFVIDPESGQILQEIAVGRGPHDITATADKKLVFTGNIGSSSVSVIDAEKGVVVRELTNIPGAHGVALGNNRLYVTATVSNQLFVFNLRNFDKERTLATGGFPEYAIEVAANQKVLTTNLTGMGSETYVYQPTWFAHTANYLGKDPHGLALSPSGKTLAVTSLGSNYVYLLEAKGLGESYAKIRKVEIGTYSEGASFFDENTLWVTAIGGDYIAIVDSATDKLLAKVNSGPTPHGIGFNTEKKNAFISLMDTGELVKVDTLTKQVVWKKKIGEKLHNLLVL